MYFIICVVCVILAGQSHDNAEFTALILGAALFAIADSIRSIGYKISNLKGIKITTINDKVTKDNNE